MKLTKDINITTSDMIKLFFSMKDEERKAFLDGVQKGDPLQPKIKPMTDRQYFIARLSGLRERMEALARKRAEKLRLKEMGKQAQPNK